VGATKHILLLEDDDNLREMIRETLEDAGYRVEGAASASEAIDLARKSQPHLLLTDVRMAGALDGVGALQAIQELRPGIRSVIMTGFADATVPPRAMKLQADDYLLKGAPSFGMESLLRTVEQVLARGTKRDEIFEFIWARINAAHSSSQSGPPQSLYPLRHQLVGQYFVALRSGHLSQQQAAYAWNELEKLDDRLIAIQQRQEAESLSVDYSRLKEALQQAVLSPTAIDGGFGLVYQDVIEGKLDAEKLAVLSLIRVDPKLAQQNVESHLLYSRYLDPVRS
jgi:DNA-binding NarL/FixJ family response regulator